MVATNNTAPASAGATPVRRLIAGITRAGRPVPAELWAAELMLEVAEHWAQSPSAGTNAMTWTPQDVRALLSRWARAEQLVPVVGAHPNEATAADGWLAVPSQTDINVSYPVRVVDLRPICECADHAERRSPHGWCKHAIAGWLVTRSRQLELSLRRAA